MVLVFGLPIFLAYGTIYHVSFTFYGLCLAVFIPFLMIASSRGDHNNNDFDTFLSGPAHQRYFISSVDYLFSFSLPPFSFPQTGKFS